MKRLFVYLMVLTIVLSTVLSAAAIDIPTNAEYNAMSGDELLELAKAEGGKLVVYSTTSKMQKIAEAFSEEYPEFTVEVYDLDAGESITKVITEVDSGNIIADVIQDADARGDIAFNYYGKYLEAYYPEDICSHIDEELCALRGAKVQKNLLFRTTHPKRKFFSNRRKGTRQRSSQSPFYARGA